MMKKSLPPSLVSSLPEVKFLSLLLDPILEVRKGKEEWSAGAKVPPFLLMLTSEKGFFQFILLDRKSPSV